MSIAISAKVSEGLVIGADSLIIAEKFDEENKKPVIVYTLRDVKKLNQVKDYPISIMSWGIGFIGTRSIGSLVDEFGYSLPDYSDGLDYTLEEISEKFYNFILRRYKEINPDKSDNPKYKLGVLVAGFSRERFFPNEFKFNLPASTGIEEVRPDDKKGNPQFGISWYGISDGIERLHMGCDLGLKNELSEILKEKGLETEEINKIFSKYEYKTNFSTMPLKGAIDFVYYLINLMIGRCRFYARTPFCAGDIDVAVITYKSFKWLKAQE